MIARWKLEKIPSEFRPSSEPPAKRGNLLVILLAMTTGLAVYVILSFLTLNFFGPVLLVGGVLMLIVAFHYFVWGWWLGRLVRQAEEDEINEA